MTPNPVDPASKNRLYLQVLIAIGLGIAVGVVRPEWGLALKPLGDLFISMIKLLVAPLIFTTVAVGIAGMGDLKRIGRTGLKALLYFEVMTTVALALGLLVVHVVQPGAGVHARLSELEPATALPVAPARGFVGQLLDVVPSSFVGAFTGGHVIQVLFLAVLVGLALAGMGEPGQRGVRALEAVAAVCFRIVAMVMRLAPVGAFGAMAFTVAKFGWGTLGQLAALMGTFYATSLLFVVVVLGAVGRLAGFSIFALLRYLRDELLIVLGTASSESVLPQLMNKLEALGCGASTTRLVVPTGFSFNLDGTCIYLTMAAVFIAQALDVPLSFADEVGLLLMLLVSSKGAAAVSGSAFVTLSATLSSLGTVPVGGVTLLLGVDRFMSEARAITNLIGNAVGTLVVARWEGDLDVQRMRAQLERRNAPADEVSLGLSVESEPS